MNATCINNVDCIGRLEEQKKYHVEIIDYRNKKITVLDDQLEIYEFNLNRFKLENPLFDEANLENERLEKEAAERQKLINSLMAEMNLVTREKTKFELLYKESCETIERLNKDNDLYIKKSAAYERLRSQVDSFVNVVDWKIK